MMETQKQYLVLDVVDAGMIVERKNWKLPRNESVARICEIEGVSGYDVFRGHNIAAPIPYTTLSNMLAKLMGYPTVPTKPMYRERVRQGMERPAVCDEMAKSAYVDYLGTYMVPENPVAKCYIGYDGDYYYVANREARVPSLGDLMKGEKTAVNSDRKDTTVLFTFDNGEQKRLNGSYSFQMLYRHFGYDMSNPTLGKVLGFASSLLGCEDVAKKYTFNGMAEAIYRLGKDSPEIQSEIQRFTDSLKEEWKAYGRFDIWMDAIFNYWPNKKVFHTDCSVMSNTSNCSNKPDKALRGYLIEHRDIDHRKISVSAQIIVEVADPSAADRIRNGSGFCTCLDGGICRVSGLYNWEPEPGYRDRWTRIYDENQPQYIDLREIA